MKLTPFHSKFFAYELTKRCASDSAEKLAGALFDAKVDLNPHQVEAALFAFHSPLSRGALLADEVGLGKTIEAGLVLSQRWAEKKRRILVITPANLRKQWHQELGEKFLLPCRILEARSYNAVVKGGNVRPFDRFDSLTICSYQFARAKAAELSQIPWDLVVFDEAHRLRNVYKPSNVIANTLKAAFAHAPKMLLTATPLQNSLLELFGLISFIDEHAFGDLQSFRDQFTNLNDPAAYETLKARLKPLCHRTLRRQVMAYVPYTDRHPMLEEFTPNEAEDRLYTLVSEYLQRPNLQGLPAAQRSLMTLVLRKLLASSSFAIAGALETLITRLKAKLKEQEPEVLEDSLDQDYEALTPTAEEWADDASSSPELMSEGEKAALAGEIADLEQFRELATSIKHNAKGASLLIALEKAFAAADGLGAARKAIIFTESRKTQSYLLRVLNDSPHAGKVVLFNGSNTDPESRAVYTAWLERHKGSDRITGSRTADMRSALVEEFQERATIMIATEAGAEGINLQFCALVVNYDLPWNPQRIEQRIGRCHRYGQKHDVVVVNFLNRTNEADQRVFQLLEEKFKLFKGVFGSSDEVLGAIESGVDFEKRIAAIYQKCRTPTDIKTAFDQLQRELGAQINEQMTKTRQMLLEYFDQEVHDKLKVRKSESEAFLGRYEHMLMDLTRHELNGNGEFVGDGAFRLTHNPFPDVSAEIPTGLYELPRRSGEAHLYRLAHPLAERLISKAKERVLPFAELTLDCTNQLPAIAALAPYVGQSGEALVTLFSIESPEEAQDHLIVVAATDGGDVLEPDVARRLFRLCATSVEELPPTGPSERLTAATAGEQADLRRKASERGAVLLEEQSAKLDGWADDLKAGLEREIKEIDRQIREAKRAASAALSLEEKLAGQKQVRNLEQHRNGKRKTLFEAQDEIDTRRESLILEVERRLARRVNESEVVRFRWRIV